MRKTLGMFALGSVLIVAACTAASTPTGGTTDPTELQDPGTPINVQTVGTEIVDDNVGILVEPLGPFKDTLGQKVICSKVTIENHNEASATFNLLEWHVEYPDGTRASAALGAPDPLTSGEVAQGQKVVGNVCFGDKKLKGETAVVLDSFFGADEPLKWYQTV